MNIYKATLRLEDDLPAIGMGTRNVLIWEGRDYAHILCPYKLVHVRLQRPKHERFIVRRTEFTSESAADYLRTLQERHARWERLGMRHVSVAVMRDVTRLLKERIKDDAARTAARNADVPEAVRVSV